MSIKEQGNYPMANYGNPLRNWLPMENNTSELIRDRVSGTELSTFYETLCPRLNLPKPVARKLLLFLEREGYIEIIWKSPRGPRYYRRRKL